jgi:hypothetical protein
VVKESELEVIIHKLATVKRRGGGRDLQYTMYLIRFNILIIRFEI